jgi:hypothetical protein
VYATTDRERRVGEPGDKYKKWHGQQRETMGGIHGDRERAIVVDGELMFFDNRFFL